MRIRPRSRLQMHKGNDLHRWTVSYADFMTLMFAVFVVLYAVAANNKAQYKDVMLSLTNASKLLNKSVFSSDFDGVLSKESDLAIDNIDSILLVDAPLLADDVPIEKKSETLESSAMTGIDTAQEGTELNQIKLALEALLSKELGQDNIDLSLAGDWLTIEMGGDILFAGGSHTLLNSSNVVVKKISGILKPVNNLLRIRGYSDNEHVANEIYRSNWELSGLRAFSVLHALRGQGITGERMVVEAYGRYSPVLNDNQRVDPLKSRRVVIAISRYAVVTVKEKKPLPQVNVIQKKSLSKKKDSKEMREVYLPKNRLIITTRQE